MICSKLLGKHAEALAEQVALLARRLCTEKVTHGFLQTYYACRLVPLMKEDNGIRPVGIGETLRRIVGKCVSRLLRKDIQDASGTLQTCAGMESGIEAAIHAMKSTYENSWCEIVTLVDADNAFNRLNRRVALANIEKLCPPIYRFLENSYNSSSRLYLKDGSYILSKEGVTQGDNLAMAKYAIATRPLIDSLASVSSTEEKVAQVWFADDSTSGGSVEGVKKWWEHLKEAGPKYGYYPKSSKTHIIVKNEKDVARVKEIFSGEGLKITSEGQRHIGAALGTEKFKEEFAKKKIEKWVKDVEELADIAEEEPQAALTAFNTALANRWTFLQRTVKGISEYFRPLEMAIRERLIPNLVGRPVSDRERKMLSLPYRYGGLGIQNPVKTADREYETSTKITLGLKQLIIDQNMDVSQYNEAETKETKRKIKAERENELKQKALELKIDMTDTEIRYFETAQEKGASSWLSALPLKRMGYTLNKQEFRDAICLRYGWEIKGVPKDCSCGSKNDLDHALICHKGGFVNMRHDIVRNTQAKLMEKVCRDVQTEPGLMPVNPENFRQGVNCAPNARLDISARGVFGDADKTFFDIRVTHPNCPSFRTKSLEQIYKQNENEKKNLYNERILNAEKGSFVPLIFTTSGGMGPECVKLNKRVAEKTAEKTKDIYSQVMMHIRTRIRFALLKSTLVGLRGFRGRTRRSLEESEEDIEYSLIPTRESYEV